MAVHSILPQAIEQRLALLQALEPNFDQADGVAPTAELIQLVRASLLHLQDDVVSFPTLDAWGDGSIEFYYRHCCLYGLIDAVELEFSWIGEKQTIIHAYNHGMDPTLIAAKIKHHLTEYELRNKIDISTSTSPHLNKIDISTSQ